MATWIEMDRTKFKITTGDGKVYAPNMLNANFLVGYNVAQFNFRNLPGTLVVRNQPMGAVYGLEIVFQGADHLQKAAAFRKSAADKRAWTITHPKYGQLYVQPIDGLYFDNNDKISNTTKITGPVMETLNKGSVTPTASAPDVVAAAQQRLTIGFATDYVNNVPAPSIKDVGAMQKDLNGAQKLIKTISTEGAKVVNAYNQASANVAKIYGAVNDVIDTVIGRTARAIDSVQSFISLPATIADTLDHRMTYLVNEFNFLLLNAGLITISTQKRLYQVNGGTCIGAMCVASQYGIGNADYERSSSVLRVIQQITNSYNRYMISLDTMQTANGAEVDSFVADVGSLMELTNLVNYTVGVLFEIATRAKQKRTIRLSRDNNWINIAKQIYGLLPDDSTITRIMAENNAGLNVMLQVRKGTVITYYV